MGEGNTVGEIIDNRQEGYLTDLMLSDNLPQGGTKRVIETAGEANLTATQIESLSMTFNRVRGLLEREQSFDRSGLSDAQKQELQSVREDTLVAGALNVRELTRRSDILRNNIAGAIEGLTPEEAEAFRQEFYEHHDLVDIRLNDGKTITMTNPDAKTSSHGLYMPKPEAFAPGNMLEQNQNQSAAPAPPSPPRGPMM